ncbi:TPA: penicillin-binding protein, partial [Elizabethkingia anophelis]
IAGGIGSELTGGNFWQGVVIGGMVAGLNDALHKIDGPGPKKKEQIEKEKKLLKGKIVKGSLDIVDGLSKTNGLKSSKLLGTAGEVSGKAAPWLEVGINVYSYKNGLVG